MTQGQEAIEAWRANRNRRAWRVDVWQVPRAPIRGWINKGLADTGEPSLGRVPGTKHARWRRWTLAAAERAIGRRAGTIRAVAPRPAASQPTAQSAQPPRHKQRKEQLSIKGRRILLPRSIIYRHFRHSHNNTPHLAPLLLQPTTHQPTHTITTMANCGCSGASTCNCGSSCSCTACGK
jgi:hypothetical protein